MTPDPHDGVSNDAAREFTARLSAFGDHLAEATTRAERQRRRARRGAATATVACAIGLGALVAIPGAQRLDSVAEARAALGSGGELLHYRLTFENDLPRAPGDAKSKASTAQEIWTTTTGPVRWRIVLPTDRVCGVQGSNEKSYVSPTEIAFAEGVSRAYSPWSDLIVENRISPSGDSAEQAPFGFFLPRELGQGRDPATLLRQALDRGILRDAGVTKRDGRSVRLLVGEVGERRMIQDPTRAVNPRTGKSRRAHPGRMIEQRPTQMAYAVDASTFAPIELASRSYGQRSYGNRGVKYGWSTFTVRFRMFERVEATPGNERNLELQAPAGTKVFVQPQHRLDQPSEKLDMTSLREADADAERCIKAMKASREERFEPLVTP